ncbi:uncharacterized protein IWZ02DRAFT_253849 [Phyllosticta citriasiana]|uniref:Uncharacterized protein n=1 Tax=Phyllosticta citriasiana TaxID=595635 RepID=A0ABR1KRB5_9PEZI
MAVSHVKGDSGTGTTQPPGKPIRGSTHHDMMAQSKILAMDGCSCGGSDRHSPLVLRVAPRSAACCPPPIAQHRKRQLTASLLHHQGSTSAAPWRSGEGLAEAALASTMPDGPRLVNCCVLGFSLTAFHSRANHGDICILGDREPANGLIPALFCIIILKHFGLQRRSGDQSAQQVCTSESGRWGVCNLSSQLQPGSADSARSGT